MIRLPKKISYILLILLINYLNCFGVPPTFSFETLVTVEKETDVEPLSGIYNIKYELLTPSENVVFLKEKTIIVTLGIISFEINDEDNLDTSFFSNNILTQRISISQPTINNSFSNNFLGNDSFIIPFNSYNRSVISNKSVKTHKFYNEKLFFIDNNSNKLAIATQNTKDILNINGTIKGTAFIGDASNLSNLNYIQWKTLYNRIYFPNGNVGVGIQNPQQKLHIVGPTANFTNELKIDGSLVSSFSGEAMQIYNFSASNIKSGTITSNILFGNFLGMTGIGTLAKGIWKSEIIDDRYIKDNLTLTNSNFSSTLLNGTLNISSPLLLETNKSPLIISSKHWKLEQYAKMPTVKVSSTKLNPTGIEYISTLNITGNLTPMIFNSNGNIGINTSSIKTELNLLSGIRIGASNERMPGVIRYNDRFEGYNNGEWRILDNFGFYRTNLLFPENKLINPLIEINSEGKIGIHRSPIETLTISGNIVLLGNENAIDISNLESEATPNYFAWIANKGALRIGESVSNHSMWLAQSIGLYSTAIGKNSAATGTGSISINYNPSDKSTIINGEYNTVIGSNEIEISSNNLSIIASHELKKIQSDGVILSAKKAPSTEITFLAKNITILNGALSSTKPNTQYEDAIIGGINTAPIGNNSFLWENGGTSSTYQNNLHNSFFIGQTVYVGINTNNTELFPLTVQGTLTAPEFLGNGLWLTGNMFVNYVEFNIAGATQNITATNNKTPYKIYGSNNDRLLPNEIVKTSTLATGNNGIIDNKFKLYVIDSNKLINQSITSQNFSNQSINNYHITPNSISNSKVSAVTGFNIERNAIESQKLATESIGTIQLANESVTSSHIGINTVNSPNNNFLDHSITSADIKPNEIFISNYFHVGAATGRAIANQALYTVLNPNGSILSSYFITSKSTIQSQHINSAAIRSKHIPTNNIISRILGTPSITYIDITQNIVANNRTVSGAVFITRHFAENAITTDKFFDNPTSNFQLTANQISNAAVNTSEIKEKAVEEHHIIDKAIVSSHIITASVTTEKFSDNSIVASTIQNNAITSIHIKDHVLVSKNFEIGSVYGEHIVTESLTTLELAPKAITRQNLGPNIINSIHIIDKSLSTRNFAANAFTTEKFILGSVTSENIAENTIEQNHLTSLIIDSSAHILNQGMSWEDFEQAPNYFPNSRFSDNSIGADKIASENVNISKIKNGTITSADMNISLTNQIDLDKINPPVTVEKGGTGMRSIIDGQLLFTKLIPPLTALTQNTELVWVDSNANQTNHHLQIGTTTKVHKLNTQENIFIENGALILDKQSSTSYTFITIDPVTNALQLSDELPLTSSLTNMGIKTKDLYSKEFVTIGGTQQLNSLDLYSGLIIGSSYRGISPSIVPTNGLLVEEFIIIGKNPPQADIYPLDVSSQTGDDGIVRGVSINVGIESDITTVPENISPIKSNGIKIVASGEFGIKTNAPNEAIIVTINGTSSARTGLWGIFSQQATDAGIGLQSSIKNSQLSSTLNTYLGYTDGSLNAGIYTTLPTKTSGDNYHAYFEGNILATSITNKLETPTENLEMESMKINGPISIKPQIITGATIDWNNGNFAHLQINSAQKDLSFTNPDYDAKLIIKIEHLGVGALTWPSNVKWLNGYLPELTREINAVDIVILNYVKSIDTYFAGVSYNYL